MGLRRGAAAQLIQLQDSHPFLGPCKTSRRKWSHLCVKSAQAAAFICGTSGICWWEQTAALPGLESLCLSRRLLLPCLVPLEWPLLELGPAFGRGELKVAQLRAVISPCCSLSAAQAPLHCKDSAARQLRGESGRGFSQRCHSCLGEAESSTPCSCASRDRPGESHQL